MAKELISLSLRSLLLELHLLISFSQICITFIADLYCLNIPCLLALYYFTYMCFRSLLLQLLVFVTLTTYATDLCFFSSLCFRSLLLQLLVIITLTTDVTDLYCFSSLCFRSLLLQLSVPQIFITSTPINRSLLLQLLV